MKKVDVCKIRDVTWHSKTKPSSSVIVEAILPLDDQRIDRMLNRIKQAGQTSVLMSVRPNFMSVAPTTNVETAIDEETTQVLQLYMVQFFKKECTTATIAELRAMAENIELRYTAYEISTIEKLTRNQRLTKFWYRLRAGRITASLFKRVCRTSEEHPSLSLVKLICDPQDYKFTSVYTNYGIEYESIARDEYEIQMVDLGHKHFKVVQSGLIVSNNFPHIGASPDGIWSCDCCGTCTLEIKCPYKGKDKGIIAYSNERGCSIEQLNDGSFFLKKDHEYYYQVQMQLFVSGFELAHFVVWTNLGLEIIHVPADHDFWSLNYPKTVTFFKKVILPELIGQFYST